MQIGVAFGGQVIGVALAVIGGTVAGAPLVADARTRRRSHVAVRVLAWLALASVLGWNGYRFGAIARSLHHKTQLLKCDYSIDWSSVEAQLPTAIDLALAAKNDKLAIAVDFDVTVHNPTAVDVEIENNRFEFRYQGELVAQTSLPRGRVASGATSKLHITLPIMVQPSQALRIKDMVTQPKDWTITLYLEVADSFTFPVYIVTK